MPFASDMRKVSTEFHTKVQFRHKWIHTDNNGQWFFIVPRGETWIGVIIQQDSSYECLEVGYDANPPPWHERYATSLTFKNCGSTPPEHTDRWVMIIIMAVES